MDAYLEPLLVFAGCLRSGVLRRQRTKPETDTGADLEVVGGAWALLQAEAGREKVLTAVVNQGVADIYAR